MSHLPIYHFVVQSERLLGFYFDGFQRPRSLVICSKEEGSKLLEMSLEEVDPRVARGTNCLYTLQEGKSVTNVVTWTVTHHELTNDLTNPLKSEQKTFQTACGYYLCSIHCTKDTLAILMGHSSLQRKVFATFPGLDEVAELGDCQDVVAIGDGLLLASSKIYNLARQEDIVDLTSILRNPAKNYAKPRVCECSESGNKAVIHSFNHHNEDCQTAGQTFVLLSKEGKLLRHHFIPMAECGLSNSWGLHHLNLCSLQQLSYQGSQ